MATIVNARDVLLQASGVRVANVTMQPNIVVNPSNVDGLGLVIEGQKMVLVQATTQVFQIAKNGTVSPSTTTITAVVKGTLTAPTLSVIAGTITPTPVLSGNTVNINVSTLLTDSATIRISATDGVTVFSDDVTIVKVREGIDSLNGLLTNESHTLPADSAGNVISYSGAGGFFKVYQGVVDVSNVSTYSLVSNPAGLTVSLNTVTGQYAVTGAYPAATDLTTITLRATFGTSTIDKVFTVAKSKSGSTGQRGSQTFYLALTGTTNFWSDAFATNSVTNATGSVTLNDVVTQYNNSQNFSQTRFWDGSAWVVVNAVVDGNLLVTGSVGAAKMSVTNLAAITATIGTLRTASTGARMEISDNVLKVFDTGGTLRVQLGNLAL
jgi:hypothetical protein